MKEKSLHSWLVWFLCLLAISACQSITPTRPTVTSFPEGTFLPYRTQLPPTLSTPLPSLVLPSLTPIPSATSTPRTYVVKAGEDMGGIALRYRVPVKDLMAANPLVNPRLMKVGTVLIIPGEAPVAVNPAVKASPTLAPVVVGAAACVSDPAGGAWCFTEVRNQGTTALINVTVQLTLVDASGKELSRQNVALPLDLLPAGAVMPLAGFFSPPLPASARAGVQLVSALPANAASERYPVVDLASPQITISPDGTTADVAGRASAAGKPGETAQLSVLAVAYASSGEVVGMRRWDSAKAAPANQPIEFNLKVYSVAGPIQHVSLFAEARK